LSAIDYDNARQGQTTLFNLFLLSPLSRDGQMSAKKLTALAVANARPRRSGGKLVRTTYPDGGTGLCLLVQPNGTRSWAQWVRVNGTQVKLTLKPTENGGLLSLAAAREAAAIIRHQVERGIDPRVERQAAQAAAQMAEQARAADAIEMMVDEFLTLYAKRKTRPVTWQAYERMLRRLVLPVWAGRSVQDIRRRDVIALVDAIAVDRPYMANRTLGTLSRFFSWLVARDVLETSPCFGVEHPGVEVARDHVLTADEIATLMRTCAKLGPAGDCMRLMVYTAARRSEVGGMAWSELDHDQRALVIPAHRSKNRKPHIIPLVSAAWDILMARHGNSPRSCFLTKGATGR
jgi:Arm DNA-binding domain/Phage integrase family